MFSYGDKRCGPDIKVFAVGVLVGGILTYMNLYYKISNLPLYENTHTMGGSKTTAELREEALLATNHSVSKEIEGYKFSIVGRPEVVSLSDFSIASKGHPFRNVIFSSWKSGSTFLGDVLEAHPGTFYESEPEEYFQEFDNIDTEQEFDLIKALLKCDYNNVPHLAKFLNHVSMRSNKTHKKTLFTHCETNPEVCQCPTFLSKMCQLHPLLNLKLSRPRVELGLKLLEDESLKNIRVILLIRDPRGVMESRLRDPGWCQNKPGCDDVAVLCENMEDDYYKAKMLRELYPKRFLVIRFEDVAIHPFRAVKQIFKFLKLKYHSSVEEYLQRHVTSNPMTSEGFLFHYGNNVKTAFTWKQAFKKDFKRLHYIQGKCKQAMKVWGYSVAKSKNDLARSNHVMEPPFPDMDLFD